MGKLGTNWATIKNKEKRRRKTKEEEEEEEEEEKKALSSKALNQNHASVRCCRVGEDRPFMLCVLSCISDG